MPIRVAQNFARENAGRLLLISALLLLPCFWHKRIEAGDLASHTYNAWLANLIQQGRAPGLYIDFRWNNILFDLILAKLGAWIGFRAAERIVVALSILIFFWGTFALISAVSHRPPWYLVPAIAMITYGWTFHSGFMNFYLSLGLGFFAVVLLWQGDKIEWLLAAPLAALVLMAHPVGFVIMFALALYLKSASALHGWQRWALFASALIFVLVFHQYTSHLRTAYLHTQDFYLMNGADQLNLFQARYGILAWVLRAFAIVCFAAAVLRRDKATRSQWAFRAPLELWAVMCFAAAIVPETIWFSANQPMPFALAISRLTTVTAVLALCVLGSIKPRLWHLAGFTTCAAIFFGWLYQDTGKLNDMEEQVETMVCSLPYGRRVVETITASRDSRLLSVHHMVDRACIGKCFSYANYEPSTEQFRIRVLPGSPVVADNVFDAAAMQNGYYVVRLQDLPMNQIYQCDEKDFSKLCMRELTAGEENGWIGYRRSLPE